MIFCCVLFDFSSDLQFENLILVLTGLSRIPRFISIVKAANLCRSPCFPFQFGYMPPAAEVRSSRMAGSQGCISRWWEDGGRRIFYENVVKEKDNLLRMKNRKTRERERAFLNKEVIEWVVFERNELHVFDW